MTAANLLAMGCLFMFFAGRASGATGTWTPLPKALDVVPVGPRLLAQLGEAARKPMLMFVFDGGLFRFNANPARAFEPLFQFPPRRAARTLSVQAPKNYFLIDLNHPPIIRPISSNIPAQISYFLGGKKPSRRERRR